MPFDRSKHPPLWESFSLRIRGERAGWRCECRGECGRVHTALLGDGRCEYKKGDRLTHGHPVVLTVAHKNWDGGICECEPRCANDDHVLAMCQPCHLRADRPRHHKTQRTNRLQKAGQQVLPEVKR